MNKLSLNAAVKKYKDLIGKSKEEIINVLSKDEKQYSEAECNEIYESLQNKEISSKKIDKFQVDLSWLLDYSRLEAIQEKDDDGDLILKPSLEFKRYQELEDSLLLDNKYDFYQFFASGQFKKKKDGTDLLIGIVINRPQSIHTTRIPLKIAKELNRQIYDKNNPPSNSRYFLLKK